MEKFLYHTNSSDFSVRLCIDCAYREGMSCTLCGKRLVNIGRCPDGYTMTLLKELERDYCDNAVTGRHSSTVTDWEPIYMNA